MRERFMNYDSSMTTVNLECWERVRWSHDVYVFFAGDARLLDISWSISSSWAARHRIYTSLIRSVRYFITHFADILTQHVFPLLQSDSLYTNVSDDRRFV